jgi:hypothetical protein
MIDGLSYQFYPLINYTIVHISKLSLVQFSQTSRHNNPGQSWTTLLYQVLYKKFFDFNHNRNWRCILKWNIQTQLRLWISRNISSQINYILIVPRMVNMYSSCSMTCKNTHFSFIFVWKCCIYKRKKGGKAFFSSEMEVNIQTFIIKITLASHCGYSCSYSLTCLFFG